MIKMLVYLIVAAVLPAIILGHQVISCGGGLPVPTGLTIDGCAAAPCNVNQGASVNYRVDFVTVAASPSLVLRINSTVFGEETIVDVPPQVACGTMVLGSCPVTAGQTVAQATSLPVDTEHHGGIPAQLRVVMADAADNVHFCCLINLVIH